MDKRRVLVALAVLSGSLFGVSQPARAIHAQPKIAFHSARDGDTEIFVMNVDGTNVTQLTFNATADVDPEFSPDGTQIAFSSNRDGDFEVYVMNVDGTGLRQLTFTTSTGIDRRPAWSSDASEIAFDRPAEPSTGRHLDLYTARPDGAAGRRLTNGGGIASGGGAPDWSPNRRIALMRHTDTVDWEIATLDPTTLALTQITSNSTDDTYPDWSADGTRLAFTAARTGNNEIWAMNADGTAAVQLTSHPADDTVAAVSCDGSRIAWQSTRTGAAEVWVMNADGTTPVRLTTGGGGSPSWQCVRHTPVANDDAFSTPEDNELVVAGPGVLANDTDGDGDPLTASVTTPPVNGTVMMTPDGGFTYTPTPDFHGTDSFTYRAADGTGSSSVAAVSVMVTPVNDPPSAADDTAGTPQYTPVTVDALVNDFDRDGDPLLIVALGMPSHGTATTDGSTITFTPDHTFKGSDAFDYTIADPTGETATAVVVVSELGCGEDGLAALSDTPADGAVSQRVDRDVEPIVGAHDQGLARSVHDVNCAYVVPAEAVADGLLSS